MAGDIGAIMRRHGPAYEQQFGPRMLPSHRKALGDLCQCRTPVLGGHLCRCPECHSHHYRYHSCGNRSCPGCQWKNTAAWIEARQRQLLPVTYYHIVFTLPQPLREIIRSHQKALLAVLFRAAVTSLTEMAMDPHYVGGRIGVLAVLHTWTRAMIYHPHLHCIVPGGGIDPIDGGWKPARRNYLVPVRALSAMFRGRFMDLARKALPKVRFPEAVWNHDWVVYTKPAVQGPEKVLDYLGRYVHRVAITNARIIDSDDSSVRFRYFDRKRHEWKGVTLAHREFIRRFLQHALPRGFHKVRSYGLLSPAYRERLARVQEGLAPPTREFDEEPDPEPSSEQPTHASFGLCPDCGKGKLYPLWWLPPMKRAPPFRRQEE